jgi:hypothetical protein
MSKNEEKESAILSIIVSLLTKNRIDPIWPKKSKDVLYHPNYLQETYLARKEIALSV